ncbi:MAG: hypothetical protein ACC656_10415 [Candidatus Heimdallarchaeota archaeon]
MSYKRKRFLSVWNGVALIIFFTGIFLDSSYFGYSGVIFGIFMWIIGGIVAGMVFGPKRSKKRRSRARRRYDQEDGFVEKSNTQNQFCIACGSEFPISDKFCPECGTAAANKVFTN